MIRLSILDLGVGKGWVERTKEGRPGKVWGKGK